MRDVRARGRCWKVGIVPALVLCLAAAGGASGQVTTVPQQDLTFGMVVPGVPETVFVDDGVRRAEWLLTGRGSVTVSFILPTVLQGPSGAVLPLVFANGDAGWQRTTGGGGMRLEDPNTPFSINVPNRQDIALYLGGTAQPAVTQSAGSYTATITVIVAQP